MKNFETMTDEEIIELTSVVFTTSDANEVLMPLDEIKVVDSSTIELGSNIYRIKPEEVRKIVIKKGRYNLVKGSIDVASINKYIEQITTDMASTILKQYADDLQVNSKTLESKIKNVDNTLTEITSFIFKTNKDMDTIKGNYTSLERNAEKVIKELQILIEE